MPIPSVVDLAREASDPVTPQARLAELAGALPWLHPLIAGNPHTYDALRDWITARSPEAITNAADASRLAEEASDGGTQQGRLAELAGRSAWLRPLIAANPAAYEGLLAWLGDLGDPSVQAALDRRSPV